MVRAQEATMRIGNGNGNPKSRKSMLASLPRAGTRAVVPRFSNKKIRPLLKVD
jgi:hypothetical protein